MAERTSLLKIKMAASSSSLFSKVKMISLENAKSALEIVKNSSTLASELN